MDIQIIGTITNILPVQSGTSKTSGKQWQKQSYIINVEGESEEHPRSICFDVFGEERIGQFALQLNERVRVHLEINCNEWNGRYFNSITCWRVDRNSTQQVAPQQPVQQQIQMPPNAQPAPAQAPVSNVEDSDLPF